MSYHPCRKRLLVKWQCWYLRPTLYRKVAYIIGQKVRSGANLNGGSISSCQGKSSKFNDTEG